MTNFEFSNAPIIGSIMSATGIHDGWMIICIVLFLVAVIFLAGWIMSEKTNRQNERELDELRDEVIGLKALSNLPPLHSDEYGNPGDSLVFASAKELKRRRMGQAAQERQTQAKEEAKGQADATQPLAIAIPEIKPKKRAENSPSVTAQVHEKIYASVTKGSPLKAKTDNAKPSANKDMVGNRKRKANGAAITNSDLPPITTQGTQASLKRKKAKETPKQDSEDDPSLSNRIPRL